MKQIYNFEKHTPPVLNENMLHMKLEERRMRRQMILAAIGSLLFQVALLLFDFLVGETYPVIALIGFCYMIISVAGSGVIAIVYAQKGGAAL